MEKSKKPRKQRKKQFTASLHQRRKRLAAHLEESLLLKYDRRSLPIVKGDTVQVMKGSFKGHEDKVAGVDTKKGFVEVEGVTTAKADGKKIAKPIHPSNLKITKLNLTDPWRRKKLESKVPEETRKEIEKEAEEQIKEIEEEQKREEEQKKKEQAEEKAKEEEETAEEPKEKTKETKKEQPKKEKKDKPKKTTTKKKTSTKKTTKKSKEKKKAKSKSKAKSKKKTGKKTTKKKKSSGGEKQ